MILPIFMKDKEKYMNAIEEIAKVNFILWNRYKVQSKGLNFLIIINNYNILLMKSILST